MYSRDLAVSTAEELPEVDWGAPDEDVATGPSAAAATRLGELDLPATPAADPKKSTWHKLPAVTQRGNKLGTWADLLEEEDEGEEAREAEARAAERGAAKALPAPPAAPAPRPSPDEDAYDLRFVNVDLSRASVWTQALT